MQQVEVRQIRMGQGHCEVSPTANFLPICTYKPNCYYKKRRYPQGYRYNEPRCAMYPELCSQQSWNFKHIVQLRVEKQRNKT